jgi:hypothetical protein
MPSDWIALLPGAVTEVYCRCPVETALSRFKHRARHPGHNDALRADSALAEQFQLFSARGPLAVGRLVMVDTSGPCDPRTILADVNAALGTG